MLITRLEITKDLLSNNFDIPWKRINYFELAFMPLDSQTVGVI